MYSREHRTAKKSSDSHNTPASNQFAPRRFVVQPKTEEVKPLDDQTPEKSANLTPDDHGFLSRSIFNHRLTHPRNREFR